MSRPQWILSGVFVAQLLVLAILSPWSRDDGAVESRSLIAGMESESTTRIEISVGEDDSVALDRTDAGWTISGKGGYPADGKKVAQLLSDLEALRVRRSVVSSRRYHKSLKVAPEDHERRVRVWDVGDDDATVDLYLGTSPKYGSSHVRLAEDNEVYEVKGLEVPR